MSNNPREIIDGLLEECRQVKWPVDAKLIVQTLLAEGYKIVPVEQKECSCP